MSERAGAPLAELTTLRLGGPARKLVEAESEQEIVAAVATADGDVLVMSGGSNLVVADAGFDGTVVRVANRGISVSGSGDAVKVEVAAGEPWDGVVASCVADGLAGIESLSGIPGATGATPIQNVGAYGQEVSSTIASVRAYDRAADRIVELPASACGFAYRSSALKGADRHVVLSVTFDLVRGTEGMPVRYAELARSLGVQTGARAPLAEVREVVLALRRGKGMVIDPSDPDSVSAGSFFMNPILSGEQFVALKQRVAAGIGADAEPPGWPEPEGRVKSSAAWLIERAGFTRGYGAGRVGVSSKHTLALVNRGGATTAELIALGREIRDGVDAAFGVTLVPEPRLVGVTL